jgi:hypothetical protein
MCIRTVGAIVDAVVFKNSFGLSALYSSLLSTAYMLGINLTATAHAKISINEKKYPIEHCYGSVRKYTIYSSKTNITKDSDQIVPEGVFFNPSKEDSNGDYCQIFYRKLPYVRERALQFTRERNWGQYNTPNNLVFALNRVGRTMRTVSMERRRSASNKYFRR